MSGVVAMPKPEIQIMSLSAPASAATTPFHALRAKAQKRAAYTLAVQTAVAYRYGLIDRALESRRVMLGQVYNFGPLLLDRGRVMPPVIDSSNHAFRLYSPRHASSAVSVYRIERQARITTVQPTWRQYLIQHYTVDRVVPALLPRNAVERRRWKLAVARGWKSGIVLASQLFRTNLARLTRDMVGAIRFKRLVLQHVVSAPILSTGDARVAIEGNTIEIGRREFLLTHQAHWTQEGSWRPRQ